jgi:2-keto-4-pentenoate hydratase/2-oxohepta-3-ene-1,7-dioic acid hydratase in catechol pathway
VRDLLGLEPTDLAAVEVDAIRASDGVPASEVVFGPPVRDPDKIICLGLNYRAHAEESNMELPEAPILFAKFRNCLVGAEAPIRLPAASQKVDYEGELAVVIGRRCKHVSEADALSVVAGYMPMNDVSARDLQLQTGQWTAGKAVDTFAPCGPALVTADEVGDPQSLEVITRVNGAEMQRSGTDRMIFTVAETIAFISSVITLEVGDIISTGTPEGVGVMRSPPVFLAKGDEVEVEIPGVGLLRNPVASELTVTT